MPPEGRDDVGVEDVQMQSGQQLGLGPAFRVIQVG
jgi:hypothetical protein